MNTTIETSRQIPFSPEQIYAAFSEGEVLAKWWGPNGFTNDFSVFEFKPGGQWKFDMIGPNGTRYANQSLFTELVPNHKVVIRHDCPPYFTLTITLTARESGTLLHWQGVFDDAKVLDALRAMVVPANEQNIDRLIQVLHNRSS